MSSPIRTSHNDSRRIKQTLMDVALKDVPIELQPLHFQVAAYLKSEMSDSDRLKWYKGKAKYRNNFKVK